MTAIEFRDVSFRTPSGRHLIEGISLRIEAGTTTALLGRSGSGKTTLLKMVNRLIEPTSGQVLVHGRATTEGDSIALRRGIGYVIQETGLFPHFNVARNVGVVPEIEGWTGEAIRRRSAELLQMVGLEEAGIEERFPHQLSGGQRQRVGLARALAVDPPVLLMDEPFGALDPLTRAAMQQMLRALLARLKKTVLLVTHDLDEALYLASRIVLLEGGRIAADLPSGEFLQSRLPAVEEYVRAFQRHEIRAADLTGGRE